MPEVAKKVIASFDADEKINPVDAVKRYPMLFAEMMVFALPEKHREFFRVIQGLSHDEMMQKLNEYMT